MTSPVSARGAAEATVVASSQRGRLPTSIDSGPFILKPTIQIRRRDTPSLRSI
jgi:hypothetical protein